MKELILSAFEQHPHLAFFFSLFISILIAIVGVLPSFFITAANILFFGFWTGTLVSFLGEAFGAAIAFILYRKGFKSNLQTKLRAFSSIKMLLNAENKNAFALVFSLRLLPFVPSGLITFAAAIGKISFLSFLISSSLGKLPALLLEAYSVNAITKFNWEGKLILSVAAGISIYLAVKKLQARDRDHS